MGKEEKNGQVH